MPTRPSPSPTAEPARLDQYLTAAEVAQRLGVAEETVRIWTRRGDIPAVKLGRGGGPRHRVRYREADIVEWLSRQPKAGA